MDGENLNYKKFKEYVTLSENLLDNSKETYLKATRICQEKGEIDEFNFKQN